MKLSNMIDLLEKLKSQDGDIEITEISVELNESRTTTIPMKAYANALKSKKADTGDFCLYFHNAPISKALEEQKNELLRQISLHANRGASSIEELSEKLVMTDANEYAFDLLCEDGMIDVWEGRVSLTRKGERHFDALQEESMKQLKSDGIPF